VRILGKILSNIAMRIPGAKSQFLPSLEDLEDQVCRELAERLEGKSVRETLTNILEWQERNVRYWNERCYVDIVPSRALILVYFLIFFTVSIPILTVIYILLTVIAGFYLATLVLLAMIGIPLYTILRAPTSVKLVYILAFSYPLHQYLRSVLTNIPKPNIATFILDVAVFNWIIFGFSMFLLAYLSLAYSSYARTERTFVAKVKRLWSLTTHTFSLSLPVSKIIDYRLAVCRDYAKLTATLLCNLFPYSDIFFFTFLGHVATGIEINGKIYVLDQRLPILTLEKWLQRWKRRDANSYKLVIKNGDVDIEKINMPLSRSRASCCFENIEKSVLKALNIRPRLENSTHKMEIPLKNYALYYENDEIVKYSIIRSIKNAIEREFCGAIDKVTDIKIRRGGDKKDLVLEVYYDRE